MIKVNLLDFLKRKKQKLLEVKGQESTKSKENEVNIGIIILNHNEEFANEEELIMQNAKALLENGFADSLQDGIISSATMFRGLKYKGIEEENGIIKIILEDTAVKKTL